MLVRAVDEILGTYRMTRQQVADLISEVSDLVEHPARHRV